MNHFAGAIGVKTTEEMCLAISAIDRFAEIAGYRIDTSDPTTAAEMSYMLAADFYA